MRKDRVLTLALVCSAAFHAGVLLLWEGKGARPERDLPKQMIARLLPKPADGPGTEVGGRSGTPARDEAETVHPARRPPAAAVGQGAYSARPLGASALWAEHPATGGMKAAAAGVVRPGSRHLAAVAPTPSVGGESGIPSVAADPLAEIRRLVEEKKSYPVLARRRGWEGEVVVELDFQGDGAVADVRVVEGSGYGVLDRATVSAVRRAGPFPELSGRVRIPVIYRLEGE